ncbi:hypothetical protein NAC44_05755 [Allorhizobium sp. BGMRC 0089]|uniref:O-linked N-acetylglucosamine transferase, SPINDLY family protein n=1 Tax=Allorhizobium sonneratiae TaxID=2934936 RepID=UPI0020347E9C|nr:hypothetical protein [Allorhizobium sonneratiae]MCM2291830.1 hypothetical protein [Allorhizobium sonneratiae]
MSMDHPIEAALAAYNTGDLDAALGFARAAADREDERSGMGFMLIANIHLKRKEMMAAADGFVAAAARLPDKAAEFLKFAANIFIVHRQMDRLAAIAVSAAAANAGDGDFLAEIGNKLLGAGLHKAIDGLMPFLDMKNGHHLQIAITHYQLTRRPSLLKPIIEARYRESPDDSFVAMNYFAFCRSSLHYPGMRAWLAMMETPDDPLTAEILYRDTPLSRRYWADDEAIHAHASGFIDRLPRKAGEVGPKRRAIGAEGERLKIGYLSSDFTIHATMYLLYDVFLAHDRRHFDITLFCTTPAGQAAIQNTWDPRLKAEIVALRHLSDPEAIAEISRREIDILIDLKGYTSGFRAGIVAGADAPVKATWIGYPGSVKHVDLDYHITDPIVTPDAAKPFFEEKLCRLPETYQGNGSLTKPRPRGASRAAHGLPKDAFVFASFNSPAKISPETIDLWARVMAAVPDSVFWVLVNDDLLKENLTAEFTRLGVARERIVFAEGKPYEQHIDRVGLADLALDSFPYNGHTTTSDLLWGGLPVLTRRGKTFAARVSESLLAAIGLSELVAKDDAAFLAMAVDFARHREKIVALKQKLTDNRRIMPLFDTERFVRHLENAYRLMAERARKGLGPDHIDVPALPVRSASFLAESLPERLLTMVATENQDFAPLIEAYRRRDYNGILRYLDTLQQADSLPAAMVAMIAEAQEQAGHLEQAATLYAEAGRADAALSEPLFNKAMVLFNRLLIEKKSIHLTGYELAGTLLECQPTHPVAYPYRRHAMQQLAAVEDQRSANALAVENIREGDGFYRRNQVLFDHVTWCGDEAVNAMIDVSDIYPPFDEKSRAARRARPHVFADRSKGEKIRLGYVFSDFHPGHPVMRVLRGVFACHDPARFEVAFFCIARRQFSAEDTAFRQSLGRLIPLGGLSLHAAHQAIREAGIDVLVDLNGPTAGGWPQLINSGPAPIQVAYIGFPGSGLGIDCDYVIGDRFVTPDKSAPYYHEKFCRLPDSYQANDNRDRPRPEPAQRADFSLPEGLLLSSFNDIRKLTPDSIDLWSKVLARLPEARLLLIRTSPLQERNLLAAFAGNGIAADQIVFGERLDYARHLSRIPLTDLGLDSTPYNGHATTSDMLWAGLPVLTLKGTHFASRVSESLLNAIGLPELVAQTPEDYVEMAVALARAPDALARLRQKLAQNLETAPLFDTERFTRHLECGFEMMVARAKAGHAPHHIDVPSL